MKHQRRLQIQKFIEAIGLIRRLMEDKRGKFFKKFKLTVPQMLVFYRLSEPDKTTVKDVSESMNITSSAATQLVESMVKLGYVSRQPDPADRRAVLLSLTSKGQKKFRQFNAMHLQHMEFLLQGLSDHDMEVLLSLPQKMINQINKSK